MVQPIILVDKSRQYYWKLANFANIFDLEAGISKFHSPTSPIQTLGPARVVETIF
jgi:hypothetical protein